jgi:hypothetical protein
MPTRYQILRNRAENYSRMVNDQARKCCKEAGLDPSLLGLHPHNAMVSLHYGKPWKGVDYSLVRKTIWLCDEVQWQAHRLLDAYCQRKRRELGSKYHDFMHREEVERL